MTLSAGRYVFCERGRIADICKGVEGIRIDSAEDTLNGYQIYLVEQWYSSPHLHTHSLKQLQRPVSCVYSPCFFSLSLASLCGAIL